MDTSGPCPYIPNTVQFVPLYQTKYLLLWPPVTVAPHVRPDVPSVTAAICPNTGDAGNDATVEDGTGLVRTSESLAAGKPPAVAPSCTTTRLLVMSTASSPC